MKRLALALTARIAALPAWAGEVTSPQVRHAGSAIRVGDEFYLGTSTFGYFPGLCAAWGHDV